MEEHTTQDILLVGSALAYTDATMLWEYNPEHGVHQQIDVTLTVKAMSLDGQIRRLWKSYLGFVKILDENVPQYTVEFCGDGPEILCNKGDPNNFTPVKCQLGKGKLQVMLVNNTSVDLYWELTAFCDVNFD